MAAAASSRATRIAAMLSGYVPIEQRFPKCYQQFLEDLKRPRKPVNYRPPSERVFWDASQQKAFPVIEPPIPVIYPSESQRGLWGGEGIVKGYRRRKDAFGRVPSFWFPDVRSVVLYSEILDKYLKIEVTECALNQIDAKFGLDMYLLKTPVQDLNSQLAFDLRRKLLLALARKDLYPNDAEKRQAMLVKYAEFVIPEEEAEWFGLTVRKATWKLLEQEQSARGTPLKHALRAKYIEQLKAEAATESQQEA